MATRISYGAAPITDSTGLISSYTGGGKSSSSSQRPLTNASGLISGYSSSDANVPQTTTGNTSDPLGKYSFDPATGLNKQGLTRGQQAAQDYQGSTQTVTNVKSPAIAAATSDALKQEQQLSGGLIKSFSDYLNEAKQMQEQSKNQVNQDTATINALPSKLESSLSDTVKNFANTTGQLDQKVTDLNDQNAKTVAGNISNLDALNAQYEAAARAVADRSLGNALARNNIFHSASGTPTSNSGYQNALAASTTANTLLPVEREISQNRISQLTNYITPQQRQLYSDRLAQVTGLEMPVAQTLVQYGITNASQVAQLQAQLAGRSLNEQIQYLGTLGVPLDMAQKIAITLPQAIAQLANIDQSNNFYGLAQDYQAPLPGGLQNYYLPTPTVNNGSASGGYRGYQGSGSNVASNANGNTLPRTVGPGVAINGSGQVVDANGNIIGYPTTRQELSLPTGAGYYRNAPPLSGQPMDDTVIPGSYGTPTPQGNGWGYDPSMMLGPGAPSLGYNFNFGYN
jgi:hypothetical protein